MVIGIVTVVFTVLLELTGFSHFWPKVVFHFSWGTPHGFFYSVWDRFWSAEQKPYSRSKFFLRICHFWDFWRFWKSTLVVRHRQLFFLLICFFRFLNLSVFHVYFFGFFRFLIFLIGPSPKNDHFFGGTTFWSLFFRVFDVFVGFEISTVLWITWVQFWQLLAKPVQNCSKNGPKTVFLGFWMVQFSGFGTLFMSFSTFWKHPKIVHFGSFLAILEDLVGFVGFDHFGEIYAVVFDQYLGFFRFIRYFRFLLFFRFILVNLALLFF